MTKAPAEKQWVYVERRKKSGTAGGHSYVGKWMIMGVETEAIDAWFVECAKAVEAGEFVAAKAPAGGGDEGDKGDKGAPPPEKLQASKLRKPDGPSPLERDAKGPDRDRWEKKPARDPGSRVEESSASRRVSREGAREPPPPDRRRSPVGRSAPINCRTRAARTFRAPRHRVPPPQCPRKHPA